MVARVSSSDFAGNRFGQRVAAVIGPLAFAALVLLGGSLAGPPAQAAQICGDRGEILKRLAKGHEETPQALGLSADGGVLEILVSPKGGWTMLVTYPKQPTCVIAVGQAWQTLRLAGQPA
jgi:hypothetical protein